MPEQPILTEAEVQRAGWDPEARVVLASRLADVLLAHGRLGYCVMGGTAIGPFYLWDKGVTYLGDLPERLIAQALRMPIIVFAAVLREHFGAGAYSTLGEAVRLELCRRAREG